MTKPGENVAQLAMDSLELNESYRQLILQMMDDMNRKYPGARPFPMSTMALIREITRRSHELADRANSLGH